MATTPGTFPLSVASRSVVSMLIRSSHSAAVSLVTLSRLREGVDRGDPSLAPHVAALRRDAGLLVADLGERGDALADFPLRGQRKAEPEPRLAVRAVDRPFRAGIERNAGIGGGLDQLHDVDLVGQLHPQEDAALRHPRLDRRAKFAFQRLDHGVELFLEGLRQLVDMLAKI